MRLSLIASLLMASTAVMAMPYNKREESTSTSLASVNTSSSTSSIDKKSKSTAAASVGPVDAPTGANVQGGVYVSCNKPGVFALTFDDGPYEYSWDLAKSLNEQGIAATFFINGKNWVNVLTDSVTTSDGKKTYMEVVKHYKDMGHEVASHTYEHKELAGLSDSEIEYQMNTQSDIIYKAIGKRPAIMRPPAGSYDDNTLKVLRKLGYSVVTWDVDTRDWATHNLNDEEKAYKTMDKDTSSILGHITLEHEVYDQTVNGLVPWAIKYVKSKNYKFVTMSECLGVTDYYQ
ncbi:hypothetical protein HMPREF1544_10907 [Mucor circinelloides 1006PhL]|uniref:NodB homology domain-containing protein n=1 Tax=Mucor circinelloides f. circinelloides (strain 1006PhL) TaxID=1220926 RepID=S2JRF5_MUCC1|nr:hypothetical protein HMPREF1544_10907 [Mucor circinelloides 1006PhL]